MDERGGAFACFSEPDRAPLLVCFSHLRWNFVWQRPQHLLTRAARNHRVVFIEEPVFGAAQAPRLEVGIGQGGVRVAVPHLPRDLGRDGAVAAQRGLVEDLLDGEPAGARRVLWYYTPMALAFSRGLPCDAVVFDKMDELSAFRGASPELLSLERELLARADVVFTGGASLYEATRPRHGNVHLFPSSIEFDHFAQARTFSGPEPADQAAIARPRLGFFGVVDERMDLDLVRALAQLRPDWHFVMVGPVVKIEEATLPRRDNIHWLGGKGYPELPRYLAGWDLGIMPFALNESTRFISPTKTPEFLAAGLPVISTPVVDVVRSYGERGLVEIAASPQEFVAKAEALLAAPREGWRRAVDRHLAAGSWDRTWAAMHGLIEAPGSLARPSRPAAPATALVVAAE